MMAQVMSDPLIQDLARFAGELTAAAGEIAMAQFGATTSRQKPDGSEVTSADLAVQEMLIQRIRRRYADHAVIAEETIQADNGGHDPAGVRYCWIIDPVDGTRNYARRFPVFATSIAVMERGKPVVGAIRGA